MDLTSDVTVAVRSRLDEARGKMNECQFEAALEILSDVLVDLSAMDEDLLEAEAQLLNAEMFAGQGRWDDALEAVSWLDARRDEEKLNHLVAEALLIRGELLSYRGGYADAQESLESAHQLALKVGDEMLAIRVDVQRGALLSRTGESELGTALILECVKRLVTSEKQKKHLDVVASALNQHGLALFRQGELHEAAQVLQRTLDLLKDTPHHNERGETLRYLGVIESTRGQYSDALKNHVEALRLFKNTQNPLGQAKVYNSMGRHFLSINEIDEAVFFLEKSEELYRKLRADAELATIYGKLGEVYMRVQDFKGAIDYFHKDLDLSDRFKNYYALGFTYRNLGRIYAHLEQPEKARKYLHESLGLFQYVMDKLNTGRVYGDLAHLHLTHNEVDEAEDCVKRGLECVADSPRAYDRHWLLALQGSCARHRGRLGEADEKLRTALRNLSQPETVVWQVEITMELGEVRREEGLKSEALTHYRDALKMAKTAGVRKLTRRIMSRIEHVDEQELLTLWTTPKSVAPPPPPEPAAKPSRSKKGKK